MKKLLSILLAITLILGSFISVAAEPNKQIEKLHNVGNQIRNIEKEIALDPSLKGLTDNDEVRIIVELQNKPLIEYATEKGVKLDKLDKAIAKQVKESLIKSQDDVKGLIKSNKINIKYHNEFVNVANGFSGTTTLGEAKQIEGISGVKSVSIANVYDRPEPEMTTSKDIIKAVETWNNLGYKGEGMVVAIVDTGIDPSHRDMVLTSPGNAKLHKSEVEEIGLQGTWRTDKVPYGYNYMDQNQEILDLGPGASRHGMHVAGTVAANGDESNGGIKGVAPEAQLLAMKVFGNNPAMPSTFGDVIIKAIDDSVALGADVINMSLGSTASFVMPNDLEQDAIRRAVESGVVNSVSAGNSTQFGAGWDNPYASNPDIGVIGSPGLATDSIQVASIENTHITAKALEYVYNGTSYKAGYMSSGPDPVSTFNRPVEFVYCGLGGVDSDFVNVAGKVALIERGTYNFVVKIENAQKNGAIGVIVYNNVSGGEALVSMMYPEGGTIPAVFIQRSHGLKLLGLLNDEDTNNNFIEFKGATTVVPNPSSGKMAASTSWGTTPNLDFKPEITAPGGNIWSTDNNNGYQLMSGTSMAAPHVSGGSALVLQRVDEEFGLSDKEKVEMAKNLIMSTANPLGDKGYYNNKYGLSNYNFTSPRRQGAGVMNLYAATTTPAVVTDKNTGISKVNLKEMGDVSTFTLTVSNFGDQPVSYKVKGTVQTDLADGEYNYLETQGVYVDGTVSASRPWTGKFPISFDKETIEVPAGGSVDLNVSIDLTNAVDWMSNAPINAIFPNGTFIEGFVRLVDVNDVNPTLSIPYVGFYGQWDQAPIIDGTNYDENGRPFYGSTTMSWLDKAVKKYKFLGYGEDGSIDANNIAFSPNNDGTADTIVPLLSFLRNAREIDIDILDKDGNKLRDLAYEEYLRKNYYDSGRSSKFTSHDIWTWDGTINNKPAVDGEYIYEIKTRVDYPGADWQTLRFPVRVDRQEPIIENVEFNKETQTLTVKANDGDYTVKLYELIENGVVIADSVDGTFDLASVNYTSKTFVRVHDFAWNTTDKKLESVFKGENGEKTTEEQQPSDPTISDQYPEPVGPAEGDTTIPTVMVETPEFFGIYNTSELTVSGYIQDKSSIDMFKVNGKDVPFVFNTATGNWNFNTTVVLEDGYHSINIEARDSAGNEIGFAHKVFVDTKAPEINMTQILPEDTKEASIRLSAIITDNLPSMRVIVNGNMLTNIAPDWSYFKDLPAASYELAYDVPLEYGKNIIKIEAIDDAGNLTSKVFAINRIKVNKK